MMDVFIGWLGGKFLDSGLAWACRDRNFAKATDKAVKVWARSLSRYKYVNPQALFGLIVDAKEESGESLSCVRAKLMKGNWPEKDDWYNVFLERWHYVKNNVDEPQAFFRLDETEASKDLRELAEVVYAVCKQHRPTFQIAVINKLDGMSEQLDEMSEQIEELNMVSENVVCGAVKVEKVIESLRNMTESNLHKEVIIPLFKNMGFWPIGYSDAEDRMGKDVLYVYRDRFGDKHLGLCHVKNCPFSKEDTIKLLEHLRMRQSQKAVNPETQENEFPDEVVLLTTFPITSTNEKYTSEVIKKIRDLGFRVIGPEKLVELIRIKAPILYAMFAFPGTGITKALCSYVNLHREASVFGLTKERALRDFYIDLGFMNSELSRRLYRQGAKDNIGKPHCQVVGQVVQMRRWLYHAIISRLSVMPEELSDFVLLKIYDPNKRGDYIDVTKLRILDFVEHVGEHVQRLCSSQNINGLSRALVILRAMQYFLPPVVSAVPSDAVLGHEDSICEKIEEMRIPEVTPASLLEVGGNICIVGDAGAGKTTLARMLMQEAAEKGLKCAFFPCALLKEGDSSLIPAIKKFLRSTCPEVGAKDITKFLKEADVVILDGCDEAYGFGEWLGKEIMKLSFSGRISITVPTELDIQVDIPEDLRDRVSFNMRTQKLSITGPLSEYSLERFVKVNTGVTEKYLRKIYDDYKDRNHQIVLTSRMATPLDLGDDFYIAELKGFSDKQIERFFEKWFLNSEKSHQEIIDFLDENKYVKEIARLPMIATIIASIYQSGYELPHSKCDLYVKRFDLLLGQWAVAKGISGRGRVKSSDKYSLLMRLALKLHLAHRRRFTGDDLENIWQEGFKRLYPGYGVDELLWELRVCDGVIQSEGGDDYSLGHLSYQEFLAAYEIMRSSKFKILVGKYFDSWWKNVMIFYAGLCSDISEFLEALHRRHALVEQKGLLSDIMNEARFTSPAVRDFLSDGLENGEFNDKDILYELEEDYEEEDL